MRALRLIVSVVFLLTLAVTPEPAMAQQGYYVLDGFGGVHAGGGAPVISAPTPYFGFDIAKDIVYVPPGSGAGAGGYLVLDGFGGVHVGGSISGFSVTPRTPYFGFNVARAIAVRRSGFVARALGQVFYDASVSQGRNLSSSNVTRPETGVYCIRGLPFTPINAVVSNSAVFNAGEKDVRVYAIGGVGGDVCGIGNQIRIQVYNPGTFTLSNGNFNIIIF